MYCDCQLFFLHTDSYFHHLVLGLGVALVACLLVIFTLVICQRVGPHNCESEALCTSGVRFA